MNRLEKTVKTSAEREMHNDNSPLQWYERMNTSSYQAETIDFIIYLDDGGQSAPFHLECKQVKTTHQKSLSPSKLSDRQKQFLERYNNDYLIPLVLVRFYNGQSVRSKDHETLYSLFDGRNAVKQKQKCTTSTTQNDGPGEVLAYIDGQERVGVTYESESRRWRFPYFGTRLLDLYGQSDSVRQAPCVQPKRPLFSG